MMCLFVCFWRKTNHRDRSSGGGKPGTKKKAPAKKSSNDADADDDANGADDEANDNDGKGDANDDDDAKPGALRFVLTREAVF